MYQVIEFPGQSEREESLSSRIASDTERTNDGKQPKTAESKSQEKEKVNKPANPENATSSEEGIVKVLRIRSHYEGLK